MRCVACNNELSDHEVTRKSEITGDYFDMCDLCLLTISDVVNVDDIVLWDKEDAWSNLED